MDIFKADFEEERSARQRATEEKNNIVEELKKLQKMHMDLVGNVQGNQKTATSSQQHQRQQPTASAPPQNQPSVII